jgi:hypothetical protein
MNASPGDEVIAALLAQEEVRDLLRRTLAENNVDTPLEHMPYDAQASLLSALISESVVTIGPGQEMPMLEFLELLESEEDEGAEERGARDAN